MAIGGKHEKNVNGHRELVLYLVERYKNDASYTNVHKRKQMATQKVIKHLSSQSDSSQTLLFLISISNF